MPNRNIPSAKGTSGTSISLIIPMGIPAQTVDYLKPEQCFEYKAEFKSRTRNVTLQKIPVIRK